MEKVSLVALTRQPFAARWLEPGDEFTATPSEARTLMALKRAKKAEAAPKPKRTYRRRDMTATPPKRTYRTRVQAAG